jgi:hypothetical protein
VSRLGAESATVLAGIGLQRASAVATGPNDAATTIAAAAAGIAKRKTPRGRRRNRCSLCIVGI